MGNSFYKQKDLIYAPKLIKNAVFLPVETLWWSGSATLLVSVLNLKYIILGYHFIANVKNRNDLWKKGLQKCNNLYLKV